MNRFLAFLLVLCLLAGSFTLASAAGTPFPQTWKGDPRQVGSTVVYGSYPQSDPTGAAKDPIEWIVIDYDPTADRALLLSRYALDVSGFDSYRYRGWINSDVHRWLNKTFLHTAFTAEEQIYINKSTVRTPGSDGWRLNLGGLFGGTVRIPDGADAEDQIFLLSMDEALRCSGCSSYRDLTLTGGDLLKCTPTAYAKAHGCTTLYDTNACSWWLRSPGMDELTAASILPYGTAYDKHSITYQAGIRPAFWLSLTPTDVAPAVEAESPYPFIGNPTLTGTFVTFGSYPQSRADGQVYEPIEWVVLKYDKKAKRAMLLSRYGLDVASYHNGAYAAWSESDLRGWLNDEFLHTAFTDEEQALIPTVTVKTSGNNGWNVLKRSDYNAYPNNDTSKDQVFILSTEEALDYVGIKSIRDAVEERTTKLKCVPTAYAAANGARPYTGMDARSQFNGAGAAEMLLRSPGPSRTSAATITTDGKLSQVSAKTQKAIRPVIWLSLDSVPAAELEQLEAVFEYPCVGDPTLVGNRVTFGAYGSPYPTPIEWTVLQYDTAGNRVLLMTSKAIMKLRFDAASKYRSWAQSMIRGELNGAFLSSSFTVDQRAAILKTTVKTGANTPWNIYKSTRGYKLTQGGGNTNDPVFILSLEEVMDLVHIDSLDADWSSARSKLALSGQNWWLRSPDNLGKSACYITPAGFPESGAGEWDEFGVRPVIWLDLTIK